MNRFFLFILPVILVSCHFQNTETRLKDIESFIQERPDSALSALKSIDRQSIVTHAQEAKYTLLYAIALDKNVIDTTDIGIIIPAVRYYSKHGSPNDKLRSLYYLGRIYQNAANFQKDTIARKKALVTFTKAESFVPKATDKKTAALLHMAIATMYSQVYSTDKEMEYIERGMSEFLEAGDTASYYRSFGILAGAYFKCSEPDKADSLYRISLPALESRPDMLVKILPLAARVKLYTTPKDPEGAISIYDRLINEYHRPLKIMDYAGYAYASVLLGDDKTADKILDYLHTLDTTYTYYDEYAAFEEQIAEHRKDYEKAYALNIKATKAERELVFRMLQESAAQTEKEYYREELLEQRHNNEVRTILFSLSAIILLLFISITILVIRRKNSRKLLELEKMLSIAEKGAQIEELSSKSRECFKRVYAETYRDKFSTLNELCHTYLESHDRTDQKDILFKKIKSMVSFIGDEGSQVKIENRVNRELSNFLSNLREAAPSLKDSDIQLFCLCAAGFDSYVIGAVIGISTANVYTRKSRLKSTIEKLDSPYRQEYLDLLG